jgi:RNA polymerase sigma-70 factor (ECF subfamily)
MGGRCALYLGGKVNERDYRKLEKLVLRAQRGDRRASAAAVAAIWRRMSGIAFGICCDSALAEDAAQEASVRVLTNMSQLRNAAAFVAWADRVTTRASLDLLRWERNTRNRTSELPDDAEPIQGPDESERVGHLDILDALQSLSGSQRAAIILYYWLDLSVEDIASVLGCEPGTIKSRLARGRAHVANALKEDVLRA